MDCWQKPVSSKIQKSTYDTDGGPQNTLPDLSAEGLAMETLQQMVEEALRGKRLLPAGGLHIRQTCTA